MKTHILSVRSLFAVLLAAGLLLPAATEAKSRRGGRSRGKRRGQSRVVMTSKKVSHSGRKTRLGQPRVGIKEIGTNKANLTGMQYQAFGHGPTREADIHKGGLDAVVARAIMKQQMEKRAKASARRQERIELEASKRLLPDSVYQKKKALEERHREQLQEQFWAEQSRAHRDK